MEDVAGIYAHESGYLDCHVQVGIAQGRAISVAFPAEPEPDAETDHELLDRIEAYLRGERDDLADVTVALTMATDRRAVLESVREIPYGEQATVEQVARMTPDRDPEDGGDRRLVREALADNPVPLFIPDHRVRDGPSGAPPAVEQRLRSIEGLS
jgi:methylated-DNA-[protein]-cysteine S-methyltransferase